MLYNFGLRVARHPIIALATWLVTVVLISFIAIGGIFGQNLFERLNSGQPTVTSESGEAADILAGDPEAQTENVILRINNVKASDVEAVDIVTELSDFFADDDTVDSVVTSVGLPAEVIADEPGLARLVSENGEDSLVIIRVRQNGEDKQNAANIEKVIEESASYVEELNEAGFRTFLLNETLVSEQINEQASADLERGELISLPLALIVLILVFGGFLAAGMPLIGAIASILTSLGALYGVSYLMNIDTTVMNVLTIIGLGVSIDYGLLMISRYREILRSTPESGKTGVHEAVAETMRTAGRTVIFSGLTIAICTSSLILFEASIMKSVAVGAAAVIILAILSSTTLLPAIFSLLGYKLIRPSPLTKIKGLGRFLKAFGDVAPENGVFSRLAQHIQKAPALVTIASLGILLLMGSSILSLKVSLNGAPFLANPAGQSQLFEELQEDFISFQQPDVTLVFDGSPSEDQIQKYEEFISSKTFTNATDFTAAKDNRFGTITANFSDPAADQTTVTEVRDFISEQPTGETSVLVTGSAARDVDFNNSLLTAAPYVAGIIILTTFILLFLMTGSVFIPLKAIILSALSLGASIGVITWGFEGGNLAGLLNFEGAEITGISPIILVLVLVFGFGLAMDYEVFLISRIKEEYDKTGDNRLAIQRGLQGSGRIITSAGLIIVLVFIGFTLGELLMIKQIGVALAVAVFVDMTIVRCLIVPAVMTLFGKYVWWAPKPLKKVHEKFRIEH